MLLFSNSNRAKQSLRNLLCPNYQDELSKVVSWVEEQCKTIPKTIEEVKEAALKHVELPDCWGQEVFRRSSLPAY